MCGHCGNPDQQHHQTTCYNCDMEMDDTIPAIEAHRGEECLQRQVDMLKDEVIRLKEKDA